MKSEPRQHVCRGFLFMKPGDVKKALREIFVAFFAARLVRSLNWRSELTDG
jgi:hypothetical protein